MKVTIEIDSKSDMDKLFSLLDSLKIKTIKVLPLADNISLTKGDKSLNPEELFGIWRDEPRSLESIRTTGWK